MSPDLLKIVVLGCVSFVGALTGATAGIGAAIIFQAGFFLALALLPSLASTLNLRDAIAFQSAVGVQQGLAMMVIDRKKILMIVPAFSIPPVIAFSILGNFLLTSPAVPIDLLQRLLGCIFLAFALGQVPGLARPSPKLESERVEDTRRCETGAATTEAAAAAAAAAEINEGDITCTTPGDNGIALVCLDPPGGDEGNRDEDGGILTDVGDGGSHATHSSHRPTATTTTTSPSNWMKLCAIMAGAGAGFMGSLFGVGGPPMIAFFAHFKLHKTVIRGTFAAVVFPVGCINFIGLNLSGHIDLAKDWPAFLCNACCSAAGIVVGNWLHKRVSQWAVASAIVLLLFTISVQLVGAGRALDTGLAAGVALVSATAVVATSRGWCSRRSLTAHGETVVYANLEEQGEQGEIDSIDSI